MRVTTVGVVGAGAMGSGIAALAASAGCEVVLLDIPGDPDPASPKRSAPAQTGLTKAIKSKPAAFMDASAAARVRTGNTDDHLHWLGTCDWIVEAIIEQPAPKQQLFARLEPLLKPTAIVTSNTSGIPMATLLEGRSAHFRRRFLGTHFFNPPRYMHLLELIPTAETDPAVLETMQHFAERTLGKGLVLAKDVPGFVANRLGVYGMVAAMRRMEQHGLTIDEVDGLTGTLIGRARSASFRTADLSGLDVVAHVTKGLGQATGEDFTVPAWSTAVLRRATASPNAQRSHFATGTTPVRNRRIPGRRTAWRSLECDSRSSRNRNIRGRDAGRSGPGQARRGDGQGNRNRRPRHRLPRGR